MKNYHFFTENPCGILIGFFDETTQGFSSKADLGLCSCSAANGGLPNHYVGKLKISTGNMSRGFPV